MKRLLLAAVALLCASASAQTINPNQIRPSTTNGQVITTAGGVTQWGNNAAGFITSLTTTGTSGVATVTGAVLNIPNYTFNFAAPPPIGATTPNTGNFTSIIVDTINAVARPTNVPGILTIGNNTLQSNIGYQSALGVTAFVAPKNEIVSLGIGTSSQNYGSNSMYWLSSYYTPTCGSLCGSQWGMQANIGAGLTPTETLSLTFSGGSSGNVHYLDFSTLDVRLGSLLTGKLVNAPGIQAASGAGCAITAGAIGNLCTGTMTLPVTEPDTSYKVTGCTIIGASNGSQTIGGVGALTTTTFAFTQIALSTTNVGGGTVQCLVIHN